MVKKIVIVSVLIVLVILKVHEVDNSLTQEDKEYIKKYTKHITILSSESSYQEELAFIQKIQKLIRDIAQKGIIDNGFKGIDFYEKRNIKNLELHQTLKCYDISRNIEKTLNFYGFKTRRISAYSAVEQSPFEALITKGIVSHSLTEVYTKKGWLVVDSTANWISIDENSLPVSISDISKSVNMGKKIIWEKSQVEINPFFEKQFVVVYGLYSRHGMFYPPYNFIPDINYSEFLYNLIEY